MPDKPKQSPKQVVQGCLIIIVLGAVIVGACTAVLFSCTDGDTAPEVARDATEAVAECPTSAEWAYLTAVGEETDTIGPAMVSLGEHFDLAGQDAYLLLDEDWQYGVALALAFIEGSARDLQALSAPSSRTRAIHGHLSDAASDYLQAVRLVERAIDDLDADALDRGAGLLLSGADSIGKATDGLEDICP